MRPFTFITINIADSPSTVLVVYAWESGKECNSNSLPFEINDSLVTGELYKVLNLFQITSVKDLLSSCIRKCLEKLLWQINFTANN